MLARNDVLDMKPKLGKLLGEVTILTAVSSPSANEVPQRLVHQAAFGRCKNARASTLRIVRIELALTRDSNSARSFGLSEFSVFLLASSSYRACTSSSALNRIRASASSTLSSRRNGRKSRSKLPSSLRFAISEI